MNENKIVDPIENKKEKLNINELYNDVVDVVEKLENKDHEKFQAYFKTFNKSNNDELIYVIFENEFENYYNNDLFYKNCYYELNDEKFHNIFDLKKYMLNIMKHYNLNNSFKFDDELYHA